MTFISDRIKSRTALGEASHLCRRVDNIYRHTYGDFRVNYPNVFIDMDEESFAEKAKEINDKMSD